MPIPHDVLPVAAPTAAEPPAALRLSALQIGMALLVVLLLLQAALWGMIGLVNDFAGGATAAFELSPQVALAGIFMGVIEFMALGVVLAGAVRLLGGAWSPRAIYSAILLLPLANLVGRVLFLSTSAMLDGLDRPLLNEQAPLAGGVVGFMNWLLLQPVLFTAILVVVAIVAARLGSRLPWPKSAVAGLCVAAFSFAIGFALFAAVAPGAAVSLALADMLRVG